MLEDLYQREMYGPVVSVKIESLGSRAVSVANRWMLGWPDRVQAMMANGTLLGQLTTQVETEKTVLAEVVGMEHLSSIEILNLHGVQIEPPLMGA